MKTILWLDDNEKLIDSSTDIFRENGFQVLKATTISRALSILRSQKLDGVLLDIRLQGEEDGLEFLQEIQLRHPALKVVVFTAYPDYYDQILAQRFGASVYFQKIRKLIPVKPIKLRRFFAALHQVFEDASECLQAGPSALGRPLSIFCSYSHRDAKLRNKLDDHLSNLKRLGLISIWHDREIFPGEEWAGEIDQHLNTSDIILLLVSASFLASNYCNDIEVKTALHRHSLGQARVIPVILRPVDWQSAPFGKLQALPTDGKPVTRWVDREEAFLNIAHGIRRVAEEISQHPY